MNKPIKRRVNILAVVSNLEKKHKVITYASLLFLTVSTYFIRTENQRIKVDFSNLQQVNQDLENNMVGFNRNYENFPMPVWQKKKNGDEFIMVYLNPEYVKKIGHLFNYDPYAQIGKNNFENFGEEYGKLYYDNDLEVALTGKQLESIDETVDEKNNPIFLKVIKWRVIDDNKDTLVYGMVKKFIKKKETMKLLKDGTIQYLKPEKKD